MSTAMIDRETAANPVAVGPASTIMTPAQMLSHAIERGAGLDMVSKLMDLQERWEASQARKAFDAAIAEAKAKMPPVKRNKHVGFKSKNGGADTSYMHETLDEVERTVAPVLSPLGLSYRFRTVQPEPAKVSVTCIISHRDGHSEENTLSASVDTSGNKNHLQAIGSAVTYLQRYSLKAALGLSVADDDDAQAAGGNYTIDSEEAQAIRDMITASGADEKRFLDFLGVSDVSLIRSKDYNRATEALRRKASSK